MSTAAGFLADIVAHPDDDTPRLIYADWLDDHGQPERAELIRLQIQQARSGGSRDIRDRIQTLLDLHADEWSAPLADLTDKVEFRRGFPERVTLTMPDLLESGEQLFSLAPVREVVLVHAGMDLAELAACPHLARLTGLDLRDTGIWAEPLKTLLESPYLTQLERFVLRLAEYGDAVVRALGEIPQPPALRMLDLYDSNVGIALADTEMDVFAASPVARSLERLILGGNHDLTDGSLVPLVASANFTRLRELHLAFTNVGDTDARALSAAASLAKLRLLDLRDTTVTEVGGELLRGRFGNVVKLGSTVDE